jgi:hypothetical protein
MEAWADAGYCGVRQLLPYASFFGLSCMARSSAFLELVEKLSFLSKYQSAMLFAFSQKIN